MRRRLAFSRGIKAFAKNPSTFVEDADSMERLAWGWDNQDWSASPKYLAACVRLATRANARVLECGSGLSTVLMGLAGRRTQSRVVALEHDPIWFEKTRRALESLGLTNASVILAPLCDYGDYHWYRVPLDDLPKDEFCAVVCDGPPGDTRGGRYGLLPVLHRRLSDGCIVVLDDASRDAERGVVERWVTEYPVRTCEINDAYAELVLGKSRRAEADPIPRAAT